MQKLLAVTRRRAVHCFAVWLAVGGFSSSLVRADVKLPRIFSDNMVLQQGKPLPIWGKAEAGEKVTVTIAGKQAEATADGMGKWSVKLAALPVSAEPLEMTVTGKNTLTLKNILVGEVWICSGQSNMEWPVTAADNPNDEIAAAKYPKLRFITVPKTKGGNEPRDDFAGSWSECTPETTASFSATAYFFGRELQKMRNVPVGLIHASWGGTPAEFWTPAAEFAADPSLKQTSDHPYAQSVMKEPSTLYNGMIAPVISYAIAGVIWYQGESNVPMAAHYRKLFSAMIEGWRKAGNQGDFAFLYVQIAPWVYDRIKGWPRTGCPLVREAQLQTLALKNTGMVVTMDIGNVSDIHPKNKQEVGRRLALAAQAVAYGEKLEFSGPIYKSQKIDGNKIVVDFDHASSGLLAKGDKLLTFQIAGKDRLFVDANAVIEGHTVVVSSPTVAEPVAVRYAFQDDALPNLFNKEGLPASPFRTDDFPIP